MAVEQLDDLKKILDEQTVTQSAVQRYSASTSHQAQLESKYQKLHHYYAPYNGDQWPADLADRPDKLHMTVNIFRAAVNIDARIQSLEPRITLKATSLSEDQRTRAEQAEKLMLEFLELSDWEVWLGDLARIKVLYGKGVMKPIWIKDDKRPSVEIIENPSNLRIGHGSSDFKKMDWALYEFTLSPFEALQQFPELRLQAAGKKGDKPQVLRVIGSDHDDPLNQRPLAGKNATLVNNIPSHQQSEYEQAHLRVWDYWFKDSGSGLVRNAVFVEGVLVSDIMDHAEYPSIPFIVIENDHEPGSPEGIATGEELIDIQIELNRALSHWAQLVQDEIDPAWQLNGENADSVTPGMVPKGGEILAPGAGNTVNPIGKSINQFPIEGLINQLWESFYRTTGLSEVLFGSLPGSQTSGRALAVQIEAAANRMDPKRRRLYKGLKELLVFWTYMIEEINPKIDIGEGVMAPVSDIVGGFRHWKLIAPEITPRDVIEQTTNEINKIQAKLSSVRTSMDRTGIESPEDELKLIQLERSNPWLFPGDTQAFAAFVSTIVQVQQALAAAGPAIQGIQEQAAPGLGGSADQTGAAQGALQQQNQGAAPTLQQEDNQGGAPQPATAPGGASPAGAGLGTGTTLLRGTPAGGVQALQQTSIQRPV